MNEITAPIERALHDIDQYSFALLVALAGVGIVTMALLQLIKDLSPARRWFQRWWFEGWFIESAKYVGFHNVEAQRIALIDLINLATAGDEKALYDLPIEQFTGQVNAAVQTALDYPQDYRSLVKILARHADQDVVNKVIEGPPFIPSEDNHTTQAAIEIYLQRRNRVAQHIQRSLDAIQIAMGGYWRRILQGSSIVVSSIIIYLALTLYGGEGIWTREHLGFALVIAVLGGFIAPVARDLVAALQSIRERPQ